MVSVRSQLGSFVGLTPPILGIVFLADLLVFEVEIALLVVLLGIP